MFESKKVEANFQPRTILGEMEICGKTIFGMMTQKWDGMTKSYTQKFVPLSAPHDAEAVRQFMDAYFLDGWPWRKYIRISSKSEK